MALRDVRSEADVLGALEAMSKLREGKLEASIGRGNWSMGQRYEVISSKPKVDAGMIWQAVDDHKRLEYIAQLSSALATSATDLLKLYDDFLKPIVAKLSKGFASLPDEVLGLIFRFVAHHEEAGTKYVERLSKVSRRFRRIVLEDSKLWTTLCMNQDTKAGYAKTRISRSGAKNDLHIIIDNNESVNNTVLNEFIEACGSVASRWTTLTLSGVRTIFEDRDGDEEGFGDLEEIFEIMFPHQPTLHRLHELHLTQRYPGRHGRQSIWESSSRIDSWWSWAVPNLRVLRCTQCVPFRMNGIPSFTSISSFSVNLTLDFSESFRQLSDLRSFLQSLKSVSEVELEFINFDDGKEMPSLNEIYAGWNIIPFPSVTTFRLHIKEYTKKVETKDVIHVFVIRLHMPLVQDYVLHFEWGFESAFLSPEEDTDRLSGVVSELSDVPFTYPKAKSFSIGLSLPDVKNASPHLVEKAKSVKSRVYFSSMRQLSRESVMAFWRACSGDRVKPPSVLREIRLLDCDNMGIEELRELIEPLKEIGVWDPLERFILQGCNLSELNGATITDIDREKISIVA